MKSGEENALLFKMNPNLTKEKEEIPDISNKMLCGAAGFLNRQRAAVGSAVNQRFYWLPRSALHSGPFGRLAMESSGPACWRHIQ